MSLFSKLTKNNDKSIYPWSQRKISGGNSVFPRFGHATTPVSSDHVVLYGGKQHSGPAKKDLFIIDTNNVSINTLNATGDLPSPRCFPSLVSHRGFAFLYGGEPILNDDKWDPHMYILNTGSKQWTRIHMEGQLPVERSKHTATMVDGIMYVWGGQRAGRYLSDMFAFNTNTYPNNPQWEFIMPNNEGPSARAGHVSITFDNKLYIFGGTDGDHLYNDVWSFDLQTRLWAQVPAVGYIPVPRTSFSSALVDGVMYIFGGCGPDGQDLGDLCAFRIKSQRWYMFQNMGPAPSARYGLAISAQKEKMFVIGGDNSLRRLDDSSMAYILDCSKIRYPPEAAPQPSAPPPPQQQQQLPHQQQHHPQNPPHPQTPSPQFQQHHLQQQQQQQQQQQYQDPPANASPSANSFLSASDSDMPTHRSPPPPIQNSQSTPIRPQPPQHQPQYHQNQHQYGNGNGNGHVNNEPPALHDMDPPQLIEPQVSVSTPIPSGVDRLQAHKGQDQHQHQQQSGKPRHTSVVPEAARRRTRTTSPMPFADVDTNFDTRQQGPMSPSSINSIENEKPASLRGVLPDDERTVRANVPRNTMQGMTPPPRPSREGVKLGNSYRHTMAERDQTFDDRPKSHMPRPVHDPTRTPSPLTNGRYNDSRESPVERSLSPTSRPQPQHMNHQPPQSLYQARQEQQEYSPIESKGQQQNGPLTPPPPISPPASNRPKSAAPDPTQDEKAALTRELRAREMIVAEMRKKEQWWRTEVSIARKIRASQGETLEDDEENTKDLMYFDDSNCPEKFKLFDQLVLVKAELRRVKQSIVHQAQPMSQKVEQADRMRIAALQEAAYFKAKYQSLKTRQPIDPALENDRTQSLEKRLASALAENESNSRLLQQLQQRAQHDHSARLAAEERAKDAHERAQEAQEAHQRALEELANVHDRAIQAEAQAREGTLKVAELTQQLSQALASTQDVSEAHIVVSRLEAANLKARNEVASLKQKLAESQDDMARLRTILSEREEAFKETTRELEDAEIQLGMMRDAMHRIENNAPSPPRGY